MIKVVCKACPANKQFYSEHNLSGWMFRHYQSEHGSWPTGKKGSDLFDIEALTESTTQTIK